MVFRGVPQVTVRILMAVVTGHCHVILHAGTLNLSHHHVFQKFQDCGAGGGGGDYWTLSLTLSASNKNTSKIAGQSDTIWTARYSGVRFSSAFFPLSRRLNGSGMKRCLITSSKIQILPTSNRMVSYILYAKATIAALSISFTTRTASDAGNIFLCLINCCNISGVDQQLTLHLLPTANS